MSYRIFFLVTLFFLSEICIHAQEVYTNCDEDGDGFSQFDLNEIRSDYENQIPDDHLTEEIYISKNESGVIKVTDPSTNPQIVNVCDAVPNVSSYFEVAIDQTQQIYISSGANLYLLNTDNCQFTLISSNLPGDIAMSFDNQNNLLVGLLNDPRVFRADSGNLNTYTLWHDFGDGTPAGDFVMIGDYMYISWRINGGDYLYKVTLDDDNQYVSHQNLGEIRFNTFGMAGENGKLYGITRETLYEIQFNPLDTSNTIINNPSSSFSDRWYGAAGLHEALSYEIQFYENETDAQNLSNPLTGDTYSSSGTQTIYVVIVDNNGNIITTFSIQLVSVVQPQTQDYTTTICSQNGDVDLSDYQSYVYSGTEAVTFSYHTSLTDAENNENPISSTQIAADDLLPTYYVRVDNQGCANTASLSLTSLILPETQDYTAAVCSQNETIDLLDYQPNIYSETDAVIFSYHTSLTDAENNENPIASTQITVDTLPATYYVRVDNQGCAGIASLSLTRISSPQTQNYTATVCSQNGTIDLSDYQSYVYSGTEAVTFSYHTSLSDAESGENPIGSTQITVENLPATYYVRVGNQGCADTATLSIDVNGNIDLELEDRIICNSPITLDAGSGFVSYLWSGLQNQDQANNDATNQQITITQTGTYTITVSNGVCTATDTIEVTQGRAPIIISIEEYNGELTVSAQGNGLLQYSLDGVTWQTSNSFPYSNGDTVTVYVRDELDCGITQQEFFTFSTTNIITPNGDGYNDIWQVKGLSTYPNAKIEIYDRYGKLLVDERSAGQSTYSWNGTYNKRILPTGTYWYIIRLNEEKKISGWITLKNY